MAERQSRPPELVVVSPVKEWTCSTCGSEDAGWLIMEDPGPVCMTCADMDHLVFLPSGDAALTRRAKKNSRLSAVVVRFSRTRKRYERQGLLVEEERSNAPSRSAWRTRSRGRAGATVTQHDAPAPASSFRRGSRSRSASCSRAARASGPRRSPDTRERGSGRMGRTAAGRALGREALELAVLASVRHQDTEYDQLLMSGVDRATARDRVRDQVNAVLDQWRHA